MTASPIPRMDAPLATNGIYAVMRNPIYTGVMAGGLGLVLIGSSLTHILAWVALIGLLAGKTRWEEQMLVQEHPAYSEYAARVGRFLPGIGRIR
jgi:protein-S-isoprenylcysteine O-methyltransferase Ste14